MTHFQQKDYDLGGGSPDQDIRHVKRLWIWVRTKDAPSDEKEPLKGLTFHIHGHTSADDGEGTPVSSLADAQELVKCFYETATPDPSRELVETPLDFTIYKPCYIALKLYGDFWEFTRTARQSAVKTKDKDRSAQYYSLAVHEVNGRRSCVSFCSRTPSADEPHPTNFYVDFFESRAGKNLRLPVIIDPDIENKGGDPSPLDGTTVSETVAPAK